MKKLICLFLLMSAGYALTSEKINREFKVQTGKEITLNFKEIGGEIEVQGWDQELVKIEGEISGAGWDEECELRFRESDHGLRIAPFCSYESDWFKVDLKINVPKSSSLFITTATHTNINGIAGELNIRCGNANVAISNFNGNADLSVANGRLTIVDSQLDGNISNVNGRLVLENTNVEGSVNSTNSSMQINTANSGIRVKSTNGRISIDRAKDFVRANTVNGSIEIAELDGWIDAKTLNGHVILNLVGDPEKGRRDIELETMNGDIELFFPENFDMNIDVEIRNDYQGRNRNKYREKYKIVSDYSINIKEKEFRRGDYEITGRGKIGSGKHKVRIQAVNGDVYLKKSD